MLQEIDLFRLFTAWIEDKDDLQESIKSKMISCFEWRNFTRSEIQYEVRKTISFADKEIVGALQEFEKLEETVNAHAITHDLSKYTVPTSFVGIAVPTKVVGIMVVLALPTKVVGMQASNQIQE